jgi:excisionase family DNA binding protein
MKTPKKRAVEAPAIGERLLTLQEASEVLRLNARTLRSYIKRGEIEAGIIGGRWRFRRAALDSFFAKAACWWGS